MVLPIVTNLKLSDEHKKNSSKKEKGRNNPSL